jgi:hypothetical protein
LFGNHAADEQNVRAVIIEGVEHAPIGDPAEVGEVGHHREDRGIRKAQRLELAAVELRRACSERHAGRIGAEFAAPVIALSHQPGMHAHEVFGRRDVVVHAASCRQGSA